VLGEALEHSEKVAGRVGGKNETFGEAEKPQRHVSKALKKLGYFAVSAVILPGTMRFRGIVRRTY
jgi:hypothetical protein